ncbi:MAG: cytochrome c oxidase assembly protein [Gaiellaceae bacterium]
MAARRVGIDRDRALAFGAGTALVALALVTPLDTIARRYLLSAHLLQNVVLAEWAPALLVLGIPPALAAAAATRLSLRLLVNPLVALPLWLATYFAWHVPAAYDAALRHPGWLLPLEHLSYLCAGVLLWWPVVHGTLAAGAKAAYLFAAFVLASPLGLVLALVPDAIYETYERGPGLWGISPLTDQQLAGMTMAAEQAVVFFAVFVAFFLRFLQEDEAAEVYRRLT